VATRVADLIAFDRECSRQGALRLAGVDEAGRGAWAGPVVAAVVVLPDGWAPDGLDDSKRLDADQREQLYREIRQNASAWAACAEGAPVVDTINVLAATMQAMARAVGRLVPAPEFVLVDGLQTPPIAEPARALIKGDGTSAAIAAASIVAKVLRDRVMVAWDRHLPDYGFASHKGYGAPQHRLALNTHGPCPLHRRSYRPVVEADQMRLWNESC
jgi:ribonuclease HII